MTTSQQVLFSETIAGMKKAMKRRAYESDSDSEIEIGHNRGRKLKKKGRFAHKGQLVPSAGPSAYKEGIDYAGVRRSIIYKNPPLVDDEGYEIDTEIDDDERIGNALEATAELNPYASIRIEDILAPLTASTDLSTHPTLSKPFTSKTLTDLCLQSEKIMRKENHSLWQVRHLWTSLCGDAVWLPCETMIRPDDVELYTEDHVARHLLNLSEGQQASGESANTRGQASGQEPSQDNSVLRNAVSKENETELSNHAMPDAESSKAADQKEPDLKGDADTNGDKNADNDEKATRSDSRDAENQLVNESEQNQQKIEKQLEGEPAVGNGQANGVTPSLDKPDFIHPMFLPPDGATPDRNMGLPQAEAEDVRRLLAHYIQKQEEICRATMRLNHGLLKAEQLRKDVLHWSKAEAHRDMSDGEDWYDREEWGLTEDLKKGQEEEEEDIVTTVKKTRARRG